MIGCTVFHDIFVPHLSGTILQINSHIGKVEHNSDKCIQILCNFYMYLQFRPAY